MTEEKEIQTGNLIISRYMFGTSDITNYYQVGYVDTNKLWRRYDELGSSKVSNFHNNWDLLHNVIARIAKEDPEEFSKEDLLQNEIKNMMFEFSYDPIICWASVLKYCKLKLTV